MAAGAAYLGPIKRRTADDISEVLQLAVGLRTCSERISATRGRQPCGLADLGRCCAPCSSPEGLASYATAVAPAACSAMTADATVVSEAVMARIATLSGEQRFEEAGAWLARLRSFLRVVDRTQQRQALVDAGELVAAEPDAGLAHPCGPPWPPGRCRQGTDGSGSATHRRGGDRHGRVRRRAGGSGAAALTAETDLILDWLARPGVRLVGVERDWCS